MNTNRRRFLSVLLPGSFDITGLRDGASRIADVVATGSEGRPKIVYNNLAFRP